MISSIPIIIIRNQIFCQGTPCANYYYSSLCSTTNNHHWTSIIIMIIIYYYWYMATQWIIGCDSMRYWKAQRVKKKVGNFYDVLPFLINHFSEAQSRRKRKHYKLRSCTASIGQPTTNTAGSILLDLRYHTARVGFDLMSIRRYLNWQGLWQIIINQTEEPDQHSW